MSDYHLPVYESVARQAAQQAVAGIMDGGLSADELLDGCAQFRILAICALLSRFDGDECRTWLCRGGQAFRAGLVKRPAAAPPAGRSRPLLDAIAAGDLEGAAAIAALLPRAWRNDEEYEDEFLYYRFLAVHGFAKDRVEEERLLAALEQADAVGDDGRLAVCAGLHRRDAGLFASGLADQLAAHETQYAALAENDGPDELVCTEGVICIDALALVRMGARAGFAIEREYPFIPAMAIAGSVPALPGDAWRTAFPAD